MEPEPEPEPQPQEGIFIPPDFYCPITGELMVDPVTDQAGHTYEKTSILKWLRVKNVSPLTQTPLYEQDLTNNIAMKRSIDSIRDKLQSYQLKIESKIMDTKLAPYKEKLDEVIKKIQVLYFFLVLAIFPIFYLNISNLKKYGFILIM